MPAAVIAQSESQRQHHQAAEPHLQRGQHQGRDARLYAAVIHRADGPGKASTQRAELREDRAGRNSALRDQHQHGAREPDQEPDDRALGERMPAPSEHAETGDPECRGAVQKRRLVGRDVLDRPQIQAIARHDHQHAEHEALRPLDPAARPDRAASIVREQPEQGARNQEAHAGEHGDRQVGRADLREQETRAPDQVNRRQADADLQAMAPIDLRH